MRTGTSYFINTEAAIRYYAAYGFNPEDVKRKIRTGEIHVGIVPSGMNPDADGRYWVN